MVFGLILVSASRMGAVVSFASASNFPKPSLWAVLIRVAVAVRNGGRRASSPAAGTASAASRNCVS